MRVVPLRKLASRHQEPRSEPVGFPLNATGAVTLSLKSLNLRTVLPRIEVMENVVTELVCNREAISCWPSVGR